MGPHFAGVSGPRSPSPSDLTRFAPLTPPPSLAGTGAGSRIVVASTPVPFTPSPDPSPALAREGGSHSGLGLGLVAMRVPACPLVTAGDGHGRVVGGGARCQRG